MANLFACCEFVAWQPFSIFFSHNHVNSLVSVDFFTVPTIRFQILYVFLVLAHDRRRILHFAVTAHPTAEWPLTKSGKPFRGTRHHGICCATAIGSSAQSLWSR